MGTSAFAALDPAWYDAIGERVSRRTYTGEPLEDAVVQRLREHCETFRPRPAVRIDIVPNTSPNVFVGWVGSYGRIEGAPMAALLVGPWGSGEDIGYAGEGLVLEATRLGVGTCWVAGNFSRRRAAALTSLAPHEHVICATPLGTPVGSVRGDEAVVRSIARSARRKPLSQIAPGAQDGWWPGWAVAAVEAVRIAPSGSNRQPWHFRLEDGSLVLSCPSTAYFTADVDRGIAMLHAELGAAHAGVSGRWERPGPRGVARFVPDRA